VGETRSGGIRLKDKYTVRSIDPRLAQRVIIERHYLHRKAPCSFAFGLFDENDTLVGVVIYGVPASSTLLRGICGDEHKQNVYELTRLWVADDAPPNGESYLIGNSITKLDREIVVSFADSSQEHIGYVYQATNFLYTGLSSKFKDPKVRGLEHQHHATWGNGLTYEQLKEKFGEDRVYFVERPRKHRYVYFNASPRRKKQLLQALRYKVLPYPKGSAPVPNTSNSQTYKSSTDEYDQPKLFAI